MSIPFHHFFYSNSSRVAVSISIAARTPCARRQHNAELLRPNQAYTKLRRDPLILVHPSVPLRHRCKAVIVGEYMSHAPPPTLEHLGLTLALPFASPELPRFSSAHRPLIWPFPPPTSHVPGHVRRGHHAHVSTISESLRPIHRHYKIPHSVFYSMLTPL